MPSRKQDLVWEAYADGIVHITHGRASDLGRRLDGRSLGDFTAGDTDMHALAAQGRILRARRVTVAGIAEPLLLDAYPVRQSSTGKPEGPCLRGIISAADMQPAVAEVQALTASAEARRREEKLRQETEIMMLGLRLLLSDLPRHEKLAQLAQSLAGAIGASDARMLRVRPGERPKLILPSAGPLADAWALMPILAESDARAIATFPPGSRDNIFLRSVLQMGLGDIALMALPARAERYYLFCRTRRALEPDEIGLAERLSLLMQQALLLQDDQNRMIHAAKMSALGQMSTSIAHELRQPLNTISMAAQNIALLAESGQTDPETMRGKSARILSQVERACKVMDRMRRFGRSTTGDLKPVMLSDIAHGAQSLMGEAMEKAGIAMEVSIAGGISVMADELGIEQVLVNLIQNGADAIGRGRRGCIRLWSDDDPGNAAMVRLHVEDDGPGFSPEVLKHARDAFFTTKPEGAGTGLGLSIAEAILREHGGHLLVGNGDSGARITLVLRRTDPRAADINPACAGGACA
ncbi:MAG TPA: ATP-binding protein [Rhizomicrobium sp.]|nr:ATP-binding protein [Rhizomicrobium sp.]